MSNVQTLSANALKERLAARKTGGAAAVGSKKAVKSAAQLEEEEARQRALDMEIDEMERRDRERWARFYRLFRPPDVAGAVRRYFADKVKIALHRLQDKNGRIYQILDDMMVKKKHEKWMYIRFWMDLDDKRRNRVSYDRFCKYFRMTADPWTKRLFDLMNVSLTGTLSFYDFLAFCQTFLLVDRFQTEEFGYRMFSRRGTTFKAKFSVLDLEDMRLFLKYRFKIANPKELSKVALDVFEYVDSDGDGGLFFDEWQDFNKRNWVFVRYFNCYLTHLRKCVFGIKYWVEKTRVVKAKNAKGTDSFSLTSRINRNDEKWTVVDLKDGVIDARNRPIVTQPWVESEGRKEDVTEGLDSQQKEEAGNLAQELLDEKDNPADPLWQEGAELTDEQRKKRAEEEEKKKKEDEEARLSKLSRKDKAKEAEERQRKRKADKENAGKKDQNENNPAGLKEQGGGKGGAAGGRGGGGGGGDKKKGDGVDEEVRKRNFILVDGKLQEVIGDALNTGAYVDARKEVAWRGPFTLSNAARRKFEEDFTEVHVKRLQQKYLKDLKKKEERDLSKKVAGRTYKKLVRICEDIIYARKWLRLGFNRWAESVGMEQLDNGIEKKSELDLIAGKREAGKKQMAKLMSQSVKQKGMLGGKKLTKEEQSELNRLQEEQRLLAEAEAKAKAAADKKLAEEESEYMLHATILKNCKKQEDEIHDEDNVFSAYVTQERQRLNLPLVKGLTHRHTHVKDSYDLFLLGDPDIDGLACLSEMAAREELKSRASTTFSSKPNTRGQSRGRSRGTSRGRSRGSPSPTRGRSGSPSRGLMQSRADSSQARRKAAELPPPGTKLPGLTGGLRALLPKTSLIGADDLRFGLSSAGRRERDYLEEEGLPAVQRSLSPPGESKWAVDADDFEDIDPDSYYIDREFEPIWYPHFNDPDAPTENRKSNPERSYIFQSDRKEKLDQSDGHESDESSVDL